MRFLPLLLIPLIAAGALRREADVPKSADPRGHAPKAEGGDVVAPMAAEAAVTVAVRTDAKDRERQLADRVAALEVALHEALDKVDEHRAKLAKYLNGSMEGRLRTELEYSQRVAAGLVADLAIMEAAYVELAAKLRRSD